MREAAVAKVNSMSEKAGEAEFLVIQWLQGKEFIHGRRPP